VSAYLGSFIEMGKLKVLPYDFSQKLAQYAGLRNRLVHKYNELDERKIYKDLKKSIRDIPNI
jgi:uncharacterized protein YutE (UPF0331/DUF86 family)